jgi:hypothetical protein
MTDRLLLDLAQGWLLGYDERQLMDWPAALARKEAAE